jgi:uncharacterized protein HemY
MKKVLISLLLMLLASPVFAAVSVSQQVYDVVASSQKMIKEGLYQQAIKQLKPLLNPDKPKQNALIYQYLGYSYLSQKKYHQAISAYNACLKTNVLSAAEKQDIQQQVAYLYFSTQQYRKVITALTHYKRGLKQNLSADLSILLAQAYIKMNEQTLAVAVIQGVIARTKNAPLSWYELLLSLHIESNQVSKSIAVLKKMILRAPETLRYWQQLTQLYLQSKNQKKALATWSLAQKNGLFTAKTHWELQAQLYYQNKQPYEAAMTLVRGAKVKQLKTSFNHYQQLSSYWLAAKEIDKAIAVQIILAKRSKKGLHAFTLGQLYYSEQKWQKAVSAFELSLKKGANNNKHEAYLLIGFSRLKLGQLQQAKVAFLEAQKNPETADVARYWSAKIVTGAQNI